VGATAPIKPSAQTLHVLTIMEENAASTKAMLEQILKRLDDQAVVGDQRHEAQATFNTQVSQGLQAVRKQLDLTQADVDEVCKATSSAGLPGSSQAMEARQLGLPVQARPGLGASSAWLTNDGPPIIRETLAVQLGQQQPPHQQGVPRNVEHQNNEIREAAEA
jgi:hypothetical protein